MYDALLRNNLICFWLPSRMFRDVSISFNSVFISLWALSTTRHRRAKVLESSLRVEQKVIFKKFVVVGVGNLENIRKVRKIVD